MNRPADAVLHASAVAHHGRGVLIRGASGTGKSALAFAMLARGATLIADDRTCLRRAAHGVLAWSPDAILGRIEARGIGILQVPFAPPTPISLVLDLDVTEPDRLPPDRYDTLEGVSVPMIRAKGRTGLADVVMLLLAGARLT